MLITIYKRDPKVTMVFGSIPAIRVNPFFSRYIGKVGAEIITDRAIYWCWDKANDNANGIYENEDILIIKQDEIFRSKRG